MRNLASTQPDRVRSLAAQWQTWAARTHVDPLRDPFQATPATKGKRNAKD